MKKGRSGFGHVQTLLLAGAVCVKYPWKQNLMLTITDDRLTDDRVNIGQPVPGKCNCRVLQFFNWIETRDKLLAAPGGVIE